MQLTIQYNKQMSKAGKIVYFILIWIVTSGLTFIGLIGRDGNNEGPFGASFPIWVYDFALYIGTIFLIPSWTILWATDKLHIQNGYYQELVLSYNPIGILFNGLLCAIILIALWTTIKKFIARSRQLARKR